MPNLPLIDLIELVLVLVQLIALVVFALIMRGTLRERDKRNATMQRTILQIESDQRHFLTAGNLGPMHEKINEVATNVAGLDAQLRAQNEQLRVITRHILHQS